MFANMVLAGYSARWARKLWRGPIISSNVLAYLPILLP
jgi:hypothetical protein